MAIFLIILLALFVVGTLPRWIEAGEAKAAPQEPTRPFTPEALKATVAQNDAIWAGRR